MLKDAPLFTPTTRSAASSTTLGWQTPLSRTSVTSLARAAFFFSPSSSSFSDQRHQHQQCGDGDGGGVSLTTTTTGLEDVIRAVRGLRLPRFRYGDDLVREEEEGAGEDRKDAEKNGATLGEGETYRVERCRWQRGRGTGTSTSDGGGMVVAVKHIKMDIAAIDTEDDDSPREETRLMRQRRQLAQQHKLRSVILEVQVMRHPPLMAHANIPAVFGYGWTGTHQDTTTPTNYNTQTPSIAPFIVMEHAQHGTLRSYIQTRHLSPANKQHIRHLEILLGDVASGLAALHGCGIVHGDVKLDNVLVFPSRENPAQATAKISDFGHVVVLNRTNGDKDEEGWYVGTTM